MTKEQLKNQVRKLILGSVLDGYSALLDAHYCYVMPSKERYQFQWFWDTCFHVFILCAIGEVELAQRNLLSLFRMQEDNGFRRSHGVLEPGAAASLVRRHSGASEAPDLAPAHER